MDVKVDDKVLVVTKEVKYLCKMTNNEVAMPEIIDWVRSGWKDLKYHEDSHNSLRLKKK